ncbi:MAG: vitamin K epoxide reductase family protein [Chloroflexi bacterium]|nr:vitamin K epoxide reductase family protein [Chloroflexota bacterium]
MNIPARKGLLTLNLIGIAIAGYLSWVKLTNTEAVCGGVGNCHAVQNSEFSYLLGIPVAYLGLIWYVGLFLVQWLGPRWPSLWRDWGELTVFTLSFVGLLFSMYLTYTELFIIHAICPWCVASLGILILMTYVSGRVLLTDHAIEDGDQGDEIL